MPSRELFSFPLYARSSTASWKPSLSEAIRGYSTRADSLPVCTVRYSELGAAATAYFGPPLRNRFVRVNQHNFPIDGEKVCT